MALFLEEITREQAYETKYDSKFPKQAVFNNLGREVRFFLATLNEDDFHNNLHIYYNDKIGPNQRRYGWSLFDPEITKLSEYAKKLHSAKFEWKPTSEQLSWNSEYDKQMLLRFGQNMGWMEYSLRNYDSNLAREDYWMIAGLSKDGPFMLMDGVHRALLTYMYYFIEKKKEFSTIEKAICCFSENTSKYYFRNIPKLR